MGGGWGGEGVGEGMYAMVMDGMALGLRTYGANIKLTFHHFIGTLTMIFSEPVDSSTFDALEILLQNAVSP